MLSIIHGNLFDADVDVLVNPCNCEGVAGKGVSLQFKKLFPKYYEVYRRACNFNELAPGKLHLYNTGLKYRIISFPTKDNWRQPSRYEWIQAGIDKIVDHWDFFGFESVGMPKIGCGEGGLEWKRVRFMLARAFSREPFDVRVYCLQPHDFEDCVN